LAINLQAERKDNPSFKSQIPPLRLTGGAFCNRRVSLVDLLELLLGKAGKILRKPLGNDLVEVIAANLR
jgi:hypothetical protein